MMDYLRRIMDVPLGGETVLVVLRQYSSTATPRRSSDHWRAMEATACLRRGRHNFVRPAANLLQFVRQQFLFPQVLRHGDGAPDFFTRLREPAHFHQQVSANTVKQMITSERRFAAGRGYG